MGNTMDKNLLREAEKSQVLAAKGDNHKCAEAALRGRRLGYPPLAVSFTFLRFLSESR